MSAAGIICFASFAIANLAQAADHADFVTRWREDISAFVKALSARGTSIDLARGISSRGQKDFDKLYPPATFEPAIAALEHKLPQLSSAEVVLELMRILAIAKVVHNSIGIPDSMGFEQRLPLTFRWYSDGLAVVAATAPHREIVGCRVLKIGSLSPEQFRTAVAPFIAQENDVWSRLESLRLLTFRPVLAHLRLLEADGQLRLTIEGTSREPLVIRMPFSSAREPQANFREVRGVPPVLYASGPKSFYWQRYLADSRTLFIQYDVCQNDPKMPMREFARSVAAELDAKPVDRVVVDLRWNGGGDSRVIDPLNGVLAASSRLKGRVYVLIGPSTFSSAIDNAIDLKNRGAVLIGEPTGGRPSGYGEVKTLTLPNSKLSVRYTSKFFSAPKKLDTAALQPDLAVPMTLRDALAGRDAGLAAAIAAK